MPSKQPMGDVIVLLPGILGSVLQRDGRDVWAMSPGAAWRALVRSVTASTIWQLQGDDPMVDDLGDGVTAPRLQSDLHLIPGSVDHRRLLPHPLVDLRDVRHGRRAELVRLPLRLAPRQPSRRPPPGRAGTPTGCRPGGAIRQQRCQAGVGRPFDGWSGRQALPRGPRRLARHPHARHVRHAVPRFVERPRLLVQRLQEGDRPDRARPHPAASLADLGLPVAAALSGCRQRLGSS